MKKVTILGLETTNATMISGPLDLFIMAGVLWNDIFGEPPTPLFDVEIVTLDGKEVRCLGNVQMKAHRSIKEVNETDLVLVTSIAPVEQPFEPFYDAIPWLIDLYEKGTYIAGLCTGTFILAETGLLDGKTATTHWGYTAQFKERYPKVNLRPEHLITEDDNLFCSGASNACLDLSLYLVEKFYGRDITVKLAKSYVQDMDRNFQAPYSVFKFQKNHNDESIKKAQNWIEKNFVKKFNVEELAAKFGMGRRTFERHFKACTGDSPLYYTQRNRVEAAKALLEKNNKTLEEVSYEVGYEDTGFFREIFKKHVGLCPKTYQAKWVTR
ncbi:GlxA family transcriptional regulator [Thermodesulfobacteriota bacterium]